jgi:deazaflavin-dependent oxidoreductase (nitroreductase family)
VTGLAILETRGHASGRTRRVPVGNGRKGDSFWMIAEHGTRAGYVHNIQHDPHVRVRLLRLPGERPARALTNDEEYDMQFLISMIITPAVLDALTDEEKAALGDARLAGHGRVPAGHRPGGQRPRAPRAGVGGGHPRGGGRGRTGH